MNARSGRLPWQRVMVATATGCLVMSGCSTEVTGELTKQRAATDAALESGTLELSTTTARADLAMPDDAETHLMKRSDDRPFTVEFIFPPEQKLMTPSGEDVALNGSQQTLTVDSVSSVGVFAFLDDGQRGRVTGYDLRVGEVPLEAALADMQVLVDAYGGGDSDLVTGFGEQAREAKRRGEMFKRSVTTDAAGPVFLSMGLRFDENDSGAHVVYFVDYADDQVDILKGTSKQ